MNRREFVTTLAAVPLVPLASSAFAGEWRVHAVAYCFPGSREPMEIGSFKLEAFPPNASVVYSGAISGPLTDDKLKNLRVSLLRCIEDERPFAPISHISSEADRAIAKALAR
jgi:hypothetical protein